jgi:hypothetical protein
MKYEYKGKYYEYFNELVVDANGMSNLGWELVSHFRETAVINGNSVERDKPWTAIYRKQTL